MLEFADKNGQSIHAECDINNGTFFVQDQIYVEIPKNLNKVWYNDVDRTTSPCLCYTEKIFSEGWTFMAVTCLFIGELQIFDQILARLELTEFNSKFDQENKADDKLIEVTFLAPFFWSSICPKVSDSLSKVICGYLTTRYLFC